MNAVSILGALSFLILGPVLGCLIQGADRIVTARMQGRKGPHILQPYYDVRKLIEKDPASMNRPQTLLVALSLFCAIVAGCAFFAGGSFLLVIFTITLSSLLFILAGYMTGSPYAQVGAQREALQVMAYEPMLIFVAVGLYMATGTFEIAGLLGLKLPLALTQPLIFLGFVFVLTIKLRKSPFDVAMSHHAHQEIVRGATTEMSGGTLALVEVTHWYETVLFLGWVGMFFLNANPLTILLALLAVCVVWLLEVWIDNNFARVKWQVMLKLAWLVAFIAGTVNLSLFFFISNRGILFF